MYDVSKSYCHGLTLTNHSCKTRKTRDNTYQCSYADITSRTSIKINRILQVENKCPWQKQRIHVTGKIGDGVSRKSNKTRQLWKRIGENT